MQSPSIRRLAWVSLLAAGYFGAGRLGLKLSLVHENVTLVWPPTGIALAALLLLGNRVWPGIALGAFLVNVSTEVPLPAALGIAAGNTLEALAGASLLRRLEFRNSLERVRDVLALVGLAVLLSTTISAVIGTTSLWLAGFIPGEKFGLTWLHWWLGDAGGALVVAPVLLTWPGRSRLDGGTRRLLEAAALLASLVLLGALVFGAWLDHALDTPPLGFLLFPFLIWAAIRFGPRGAAAASLLIAAFAVRGTVLGFGPFVQGTPEESLFYLHAYTGAAAVTALLLAAVFAERRRAEEELRRSEARYRLLAEHATDMISRHTPDGRFVYVSPACRSLLGCEPEELLGRSPRELMHPEDAARGLHRHQTSLAQTSLSSDSFRLRRGNGSYVHVEWTARSVLDPETGQAREIICVTRDITERIRLEEQFRQAQKMEAIAQLAGGVAHDFNNLLTVITGYSDLMLESMSEADPWRGFVEEIDRAADRASVLTRQLLIFSRRQVVRPMVLDLNQVVAGTEKLLRRLIGEDICLAVVLDPAPQLVRADLGQMEQVIMNLAVNARDAMPAGGRLTIATSSCTLNAAQGMPRGEAAPGPHVMLLVSDTGIGMDEETKAHLFEPFFTTKEPGKGTGLGLATVYGIVQQADGRIEVQSTPGRGTTFTIYLPAVAEAPAPAAPKPALAELPHGTGTVLVVEDEDGVRLLASQVLQQCGYKVLTARNGTEALALSQRHDGPIDLVLTDVVMPEVGGPELVQRLTQSRPRIRSLYVSGYTAGPLLPPRLSEAGEHLLYKPFGPAALARTVHEVLSLRENPVPSGTNDCPDPGGAVHSGSP